MLCEPDTKSKFRLLIPFNLLLLTLFAFKYFDNIDEILERLTERISGTPSFSISRKMRAQLVLVFTNIHRNFNPLGYRIGRQRALSSFGRNFMNVEGIDYLRDLNAVFLCLD